MQTTNRWKEDSKILRTNTDRRIKCKRCGSGRAMYADDKKRICRNCGHYIFRSDKEEFIYRMKERISYDKRKGNSEDNTSEK